MKLSVSGQKTGAPKKLYVDVTMLGSFSVCRGEERISDENSHSRKLFGVLGYLILNRKRRVTQSELIDLLWDDDSDANPVNALKTLLYRIRQMLLPLFPEGTAPILSNRGGYIWNDQIECRTDTDRFEALCARCGDLRLESGTRVRSGREALDLYGGEFMSKMGRQMWVIPIAVRLHNLYMETALLCAGLLEEKKEYGAMESLAARAIRVDPLDERISCALLRALIRQGKDTAALSQYENTTELLYRSLGVRPSEELQAVYREIMASQQALETDLEIIQGQLRETARRTGAFVCEYGFFREIYRLESRRSARNGTWHPCGTGDRHQHRRLHAASGGAERHHGAASEHTDREPASGRCGVPIQRGTVCHSAFRCQFRGQHDGHGAGLFQFPGQVPHDPPQVVLQGAGAELKWDEKLRSRCCWRRRFCWHWLHS